MQGLTDEIVGDPSNVELDAFSKLHRKDLKVPDKGALQNVIQDHAVMADLPYAIDDHHLDQHRARTSKSQGAVGRKSTQNNTQKRSSIKRGISGNSNAIKTPDSARKSIKKPLVVKDKDQKLEVKSQMSTNTGKMYNREAQGNMSSRRTIASSNFKGNETKTGEPKSAMSGVKFNEEEEPVRDNYRNLDLKLHENTDDLMMQRKQRFESMRKLQDLMEMT